MDVDVTAPTARRQWGSDTRVDPLPAVAPPASDGLIAIGRIAIRFTDLAWLTYVFAYSYQNNVDFLLETIVYIGITSVLALSALMYLVARQGPPYCSRSHRRAPRAVIDNFFETTVPTMTMLVPSYREEIAVVRKTLLSAVLQEYPFLRVVLERHRQPILGNFAFGAFNAGTASYALVSLVGVQFALVDTWLGFVSRLDVPDKPKQVVRVRRRRVEPETTPPTWQDVLYRGAAATADGEYVSDGAGISGSWPMFRRHWSGTTGGPRTGCRPATAAGPPTGWTAPASPNGRVTPRVAAIGRVTVTASPSGRVTVTASPSGRVTVTASPSGRVTGRVAAGGRVTVSDSPSGRVTGRAPGSARVIDAIEPRTG